MRRVINLLFIEFKGYRPKRKEIPLDGIAKDYDEDRDKVVALRKLFEGIYGEFNELSFNGPSRIIQSYWKMEKGIGDIECITEDINNFLQEIAKDIKNDKCFSGILGLFVSALVNLAEDNEIDLDLNNIDLPPLMCLGCSLPEGKRLTIHGTVGSFAGVGLDGGRLHIIGASGPFIGAKMKGGEIIVEEGKKKPGSKVLRIYKDKGRANIFVKRE